MERSSTLMGLTCQEFTESGQKFYCGHRKGTAWNGRKSCAFMPKKQTLWGFKGKLEECREQCDELKWYTRLEDGGEKTKLFECKGMVRKLELFTVEQRLTPTR